MEVCLYSDNMKDEYVSGMEYINQLFKKDNEMDRIHMFINKFGLTSIECPNTTHALIETSLRDFQHVLVLHGLKDAMTDYAYRIERDDNDSSSDDGDYDKPVTNIFNRFTNLFYLLQTKTDHLRFHDMYVLCPGPTRMLITLHLSGITDALKSRIKSKEVLRLLDEIFGIIVSLYIWKKKTFCKINIHRRIFNAVYHETISYILE